MPEEGKFLKGLAVLDDIAYFGITTWAERSVRDSPDSNGELAAFDLAYNQFLWRRTVSRPSISWVFRASQCCCHVEAGGDECIRGIVHIRSDH